MAAIRESSRNCRIASAYPQFSRGDVKFFLQLCAIAVSCFLVRNVLFHDYRAEQIQFLSAAGKSMDEIKQLIPPTSRERRETMILQAGDIKQLKEDVALLKQDVQLLIQRLDEGDKKRSSHEQTEVRDEGLSLDEIRFKEEEEGEDHSNERATTTWPKSKETETVPDLSRLGEVPEGDLLSGG